MRSRSGCRRSAAAAPARRGRARQGADVGPRRVLITGVGSFLGTELARRLSADPEIDYLAGLDERPPRARLERMDFIEADIRNPVIAKLIPQAEVDTIVHNKIVRRPGPGMSDRSAHDINVIGSLQLLAACENADTLLAAIKNPVRGPVNVAAPGTIGLTRMVRMAGKPTLPLLPGVFPTLTDAGRRLGMEAISPDFRRLLRYGRAVDISRLVEEVGYMPRHSTVDA